MAIFSVIVDVAVVVIKIGEMSGGFVAVMHANLLTEGLLRFMSTFCNNLLASFASGRGYGPSVRHELCSTPMVHSNDVIITLFVASLIFVSVFSYTQLVREQSLVQWSQPSTALFDSNARKCNGYSKGDTHTH